MGTRENSTTSFSTPSFPIKKCSSRKWKKVKWQMDGADLDDDKTVPQFHDVKKRTSTVDLLKHVDEEVNKNQTSNSHSPKHELKAALFDILPGYIQQSIAPVLCNLGVCLRHEIEIRENVRSYEADTEVKQFKSEDKNEERSQVTQTQPQCNVASLKEALEVVELMQRNLWETINQSNPGEQLTFVHSTYSLNTTLMRYSPEQLRQSPEIPEFTAHLLQMGHPQKYRYEEVRHQDFFPPIVNALSSIFVEHGIHFVQNPHIMEAIQAMDFRFSKNHQHSSDELGQKSNTFVQPFLLQDEEKEYEQMKSQKLIGGKKDMEKDLDQQKCQKKLVGERGDVYKCNKIFMVCGEFVVPHIGEHHFSDTDLEDGVDQKSQYLIQTIFADFQKNEQLPVEEEVCFANVQHRNWSTLGGGPLASTSYSEFVVHKKKKSLNKLPASFIGKWIPAPMKPADPKMAMFLHNLFFTFVQNIHHIEGQLQKPTIGCMEMCLPLIKAVTHSKRSVSFSGRQKLKGRVNTIDANVINLTLCTDSRRVKKLLDEYSPMATTESRAELATNVLHFCRNQFPVAIPTQMSICPSDFGHFPSHSPTRWCWKRRLGKLNFKNTHHYVCRTSQSSLEELDTECHETVCHAIVSISPFTSEETISLLHVLNSRHPNVFAVCDKYGNVPLHIAVVKRSTEIVEELTLFYPEAIKITNHNGATPVDFAFRLRHNEILECLLIRAIGDDPTDPEHLQLLQSLLLRAMKNGYTDYLTILLKLQSKYSLAIDFSYTDSDQHTAQFYLQQQPPQVQETIGMILNNSSIDPTLQHSLKILLLKKTETCTSTEPEQIAPERVVAYSDTNVFPSVQSSRSNDASTHQSTELLPPSAFVGNAVQSKLSPETMAVSVPTPQCIPGQQGYTISKPVLLPPSAFKQMSPSTMKPNDHIVKLLPPDAFHQPNHRPKEHSLCAQTQRNNSISCFTTSTQTDPVHSTEVITVPESDNLTDSPQQDVSTMVYQSGYLPNQSSVATQHPGEPNNSSTESLVGSHPPELPSMQLISRSNSDSQLSLSIYNHSEETNPEEQPLLQLQSSLLDNLFPSDEGSGYSEDDEPVFAQKKQLKKRSFTRLASARSRSQCRNGSSVFRPVGSGSSSSDHSTTSWKRPPISQRQKGERKRAAERLQRCRAITTEAESNMKESQWTTRHRHMLAKPDHAECNCSASSLTENIGEPKAKDEACFQMQLSASDDSSQVYFQPLYCAADEISLVTQQQSQLLVPTAVENHQLSSETECEEKHQTQVLVGDIRSKQPLPQSQQEVRQSNGIQSPRAPETELVKVEKIEDRQQPAKQAVTVESMEGVSQLILPQTLPVLQQKTLLTTVPCAQLVHDEPPWPFAKGEEKELPQQHCKENSSSNIPQQQSITEYCVSAQCEAALTFVEGTIRIPQKGLPKMQQVVSSGVSYSDLRWLQLSLQNNCKQPVSVMFQVFPLYRCYPMYSCPPANITESLDECIFSKKKPSRPITSCDPDKSPHFKRITMCDSDKSPEHCSFGRTNFKYVIRQLIQDYSLSVFRQVVPHDLHFLFGLSPWRGQPLSRLQKRQFSVVLEVARCNRSAIPADVKQNLDDLAMACVSVPEVMTKDSRVCHRGGGGEKKSSKGTSKGKTSKQSKTKKESGATNTVDSSQTADSGVSSLSGAKLKGAITFAKLFGTKPDPASKAISDQREKHLRTSTQVTHSLNSQDQEKLGKSNTQIEEWEPLIQQASTDPGVLHFANLNHPVEVLRDHFTTYSKCCPRHDIQNIVVISSTCPASEALGPKRRYSSIKDLRKEDRHSQLNLSSSLSREGSGGAIQPLPQQNQQVVADSPVTAMTHREKVSMATLATDTATEITPRAIPRATLTAEGAPSLPDRLLAGEPLGVSQKPSHSHKEGLQAVSSSGNLTLGNRASNTESRNHPPSLQTLSSVHPPAPHPLSPAFRSVQHPLSVAQQREHKDRIRTAAELLHAQDYPRIFSLAYEGRPPPNLPPETHIAYVFITGLAYYKLGNNKDSLSYFQQCMQLAEEYGREGDVTLSCIYIGDIEFAQRNYLKAAEQYQRALQRYSRDTVARDFRMILPTQSALCAKRGSALKNASKVVDAITAYEEAITRAESKKDKLSAHTSLGNLFQSVGENARAVTEYEYSIQLATDLQDFVSLGWAHGNMGNAYLGLYQRDKALHHLEKSLDLTVEHEPTPPAIGRAYNNLGTAYQSLGELEKAEEYYDLSLSQAIYGNDIPGQARVYGNIGNLLMIKKECDRAVPHYTEVLRLSQDKSTVSTARHNRGCAYYEWAESKKKNFLQRDALSTAPTATKPLLHGPQLEDCEPEYRPPFIPKSIEKYYVQGVKDLDFVIKHHEESLHSIKGSPKGLSLSVSLFETNSRTFHRKQDCLVNMGKFEEALLTAEQSRARTLGELLLKRRGPQLEHQLTSPPSLDQLKFVVARQDCPVVYLSYTGARLLGWVFYPSPSQPSLNMFEVPLSDTEFDGKSFDYHLRYSLNEVLVEKSFEMYKPFKYDDQNDPVLKLYDLVAQPVMIMLKKLKKDTESSDLPPSKKAQKIIIIPDSYTNLLPMTCLLDKSGGRFWGDDHYFQIMPSLLTMGILDQLPTVSVSVPVEHQQMLCVVGNPTIPMFTYNGEEWNLGKLPHATKEAEWVSHILNCTPILHEQATKNAVMMRLMNAKVIHLATHGSAAAGFLAFAGMSSSLNETVDAKQVLIYPEEIEGLSITPALVVLSSCDSGRGIVKADGIQGMARAFILAGAQAVLTTLWRVPDESACIFMQFFYQYLVDGLKGTEALHKAILSVRCFSKYSQYIHWSGYQLTGREIQFSINRSSSATELTARLGDHSIFPQLEIVKQLETAFLNSPRLPTDVQVLRGSPGVKPSEPLKDFIHLHHQHFRGGIYWINCRNPYLVEASVDYITKMMGLKDLLNLPDTDAQSTLVVFDFPDKVPLQDGPLFNLLKKPNVHIIIVSKHYPPPDSLQKEIDRKLLRGTRVIDIQPLTTIHTTQRIVHSILKHHHLASSNDQQLTFEDLAEFTTGSPAIIDIVSSLLDSHLEQATHTSTEEALLGFASVVQLGELTKPQSVIKNKERRLLQPPATLAVREISQSVCDSISTVQEPEDVWTTNSHYDSWQVITVLIEQCQLNPEERLLLFCLSNLNCSPIPSILVTEMATMITKASHQSHLASSLHSKLEKMNLLKPYPKPVVYHPSPAQHCPSDADFVYVPQFVAEAIWKDMMSDIDKVMALGTMYKAFQNVLKQSPSPIEHSFLLGLCSLLVDSYELHFELVGKECFQEVYRLFLSLQMKTPNIFSNIT